MHRVVFLVPLATLRLSIIIAEYRFAENFGQNFKITLEILILL